MPAPHNTGLKLVVKDNRPYHTSTIMHIRMKIFELPPDSSLMLKPDALQALGVEKPLDSLDVDLVLNVMHTDVHTWNPNIIYMCMCV